MAMSMKVTGRTTSGFFHPSLLMFIVFFFPALILTATDRALSLMLRSQVKPLKSTSGTSAMVSI
jgi:hypothetical protein